MKLPPLKLPGNVKFKWSLKNFLVKVKETGLFSDNSGWGGDEILKRIINTILLGIIGIIIFSLSFSKPILLQILSTSLLLAGASFITGAFLGFLFGIPRTNQIDDEAANGSKVRRNYSPNTNLEQISDWLTKIMVGVGLTQIDSISISFTNLIAFLAPYMGNNRALCGCIIIYFLICGFILGFLWSRLYMAGAIIKAEAEAMEERIVQKVQDKVDEKEQADAKALSVVNQLLDPDGSIDSMSQDLLNEIIAKASPVVKVTIFNQAQTFRQQHWKDSSKRTKLYRTIPIFKALIACDDEDKYHRNHGQLGYALKDSPGSDLHGAESEFTKAIDIRNQTGKHGKWLLYELNRAFCRIQINELDKKEVFSREEIDKDIMNASQSLLIKELISKEEPFISYIKNHK